MRSLAASGSVTMQKMIGVYCGKTVYRFDGFDVLPVPEFLNRLFAGEVF